MQKILIEVETDVDNADGIVYAVAKLDLWPSLIRRSRHNSTIRVLDANGKEIFQMESHK